MKSLLTYPTLGKRTLDLTVAMALLFLLSPLLAIVALLVRFRLGSPVLFRQRRLGLLTRGITVTKFRTMTNASDELGILLSDSERSTRLGNFLRKTSLDELPQLFDVVRGEISLVGPRPLLPQYIPHFTQKERTRFAVMPGITGWAQVHGRTTITWDTSLAYDVWYAENCSLLLDLKILFRTFPTVLRQEHTKIQRFYLHDERTEKAQNIDPQSSTTPVE